LDEGKEANEMRKIKIIGAVFFAALAVGLVSVASASALTLQWLWNGAAITSPVHVLTSGKLLILSLSSVAGNTHFVCSGFLLGTVGPGAADEVTAVFGLGGATETKVNCEVLHSELGACSGSLLALLTAINLPWKTELLLPAAGEIVDHITSTIAGKEPGFDSVCTLSGGTTLLVECEGNVLTKALTNNITAGDVEGNILNQLSKKCTAFGVVAHLETEKGLIKPLSGTLAVSD